jgi:hypothetical protein
VARNGFDRDEVEVEGTGVTGDDDEEEAVGEFVRASAWLGGAVLDFAGRDRVVMFESSTSRSDYKGAALAVLEMWAMASVTRALVVTEQSSFILPASAMYPKPTAAFAVRKGSAEAYDKAEADDAARATTDRAHTHMPTAARSVERHGTLFQCYLLASHGEPSCDTPAGRYGCS